MFHCTGLCPGLSDHDRAVVNVFHCTGLCPGWSDHDRAVVMCSIALDYVQA